MSIEDIQKVNKLAQELLDQGFTESREDAVKKAQEMLNKEITGAHIEVKETDEKQNVAAVADDPDKLRNMIDRTKTYLENQLSGYKNALLALEKEIRALRQEVETLKARKETNAGKPDPADIPQKVDDPANEPQKVEDPAEEPQKVDDPANEPQKVEEKKESHPKRGEYNSDDVSVEKMFYYGNKRQD
ncbi:hypothetical protein KY332_01655 [Candidatus Woesearchaeota archaeon]|nr:hypothetical protein [Candidatus Woesearchaeota archaeon]